MPFGKFKMNYRRSRRPAAVPDPLAGLTELELGNNGSFRIVLRCVDTPYIVIQQIVAGAWTDMLKLEINGVRLNALLGKFSGSAVEWFQSATRQLSLGAIVDLGSVTGTYLYSLSNFEIESENDIVLYAGYPAGTSSTKAIIVGSGKLLWLNDAVFDIGAAGAQRPRDLYLGRNANIAGALEVVGALTKGGVAVVLTNDGRLSDARTPTAHASTHQPGGGDAMAVDAAAGTGSLRTLGSGAQQAAAGNHAHGGSSGGWTLITDTKLVADAANFDFQNIPSSYAALRLVLSLRSDNADTYDEGGLRFNNDAGNNYSYGRFSLKGNTASFGHNEDSVSSGKIILCPAANSPTNEFGSADIMLVDYTNTARNKNASNNGSARLDTTTQTYGVGGGMSWHKSTPEAINRITVIPTIGTNWKSGSRATLWALA